MNAGMQGRIGGHGFVPFSAPRATASWVGWQCRAVNVVH